MAPIATPGRTSTRRISNSRKNDKRGNSTDRRRRRDWVMASFAPFCLDHAETGCDKRTCEACDETKVACVHCGELITAGEMEVDRIVPGGTYGRTNIQPACRPCNGARSNNVDWSYQPAAV